MQNRRELSRRNFLKSAAVGAAGVASISVLAACTSETETATEIAAVTEAATATTAPVAANTTAPVATEAAAATAAPVATGAERITGYSGPGGWLGEAPVVADSDIANTVEVDVVIVGAGQAGTEAAIAAAEAGVSVAVIEMQDKDAYMVIGGEMGIWNSKWMQENWNIAEYDLGEVTDEFVRRCAGRVNPDIVRAYVQNSGEMFDHLVGILQETEEGTAILQPDVFFVHEQRDPDTGEALTKDKYPIICGGWKTWKSDAQFQGEISHEPIQGVASRSKLPVLCRLILQKAESLGATMYWGNEAVVLTQDSDGAVTGVITKDMDEKYNKFVAKKGVIMTTGDYGGNAEMVWALQNEAMEWAERSGTDPATLMSPFSRNGYGHKMISWAGGMIEPSPRPLMVMGGGGGGPWGTAPFYWCNADGKRYTNEASAQTAFGTSGRQPYGLLCTVTDTKWMTSMSLAGIEHGGPNFGRPVYYTEMADDMANVVAAGKDGYSVRACTVIERNPATVYGSNDLGELADFLGYTGQAKQNFLDSIAHYNELCYAGKDTDYGKDAARMLPIDEPPYYGVISSNSGSGSAGLVGLAGFVTDLNYNVLDINRNPIKGLYVAGNTLGGRYGTAYCTPTGGNSIGMARTHGRLVGQLVSSL